MLIVTEIQWHSILLHFSLMAVVSEQSRLRMSWKWKTVMRLMQCCIRLEALLLEKDGVMVMWWNVMNPSVKLILTGNTLSMSTLICLNGDRKKMLLAHNFCQTWSLCDHPCVSPLAFMLFTGFMI